MDVFQLKEFYLLGTLNNYGNYNDLIKATDPDKGVIYHHKGIQLLWKDDVTILKEGTKDEYFVNPDVRPGKLSIGLSIDKLRYNKATLNNYGDVVLAPGQINVYGHFINHLEETLGTGNVYLCAISEAVVPIILSQEEPNKLEERRSFAPPYESTFNITNAKFI